MTSNVINAGQIGAAPADEPLARHGLIRRLLRDPSVVVSVVILLLVVLAAIFAPLLTSQSPTQSKLADALALPFSPAHPLGADGIGRDVLAQLLFGARTALVCAGIVIGVALLLGVPSGIFAGFYRGKLDTVISWLANALISLPAIVVLLVVLARINRSTELALAVFGVLLAPAAFFLVRASVKSVREELYIDAAKVSGLRDLRIMRRHVLPVVLGPSIIQAALFAAAGIGIEAGLAFLGLGSSDHASWGLMLNDASQNIYNAPLLLLWPSLAIVLTITAFTLIANGLRDALGASPNSGTRAIRRARRPAQDVATAPAPHIVVAAGDSSAMDGGDDDLVVLSNLTVSYPHNTGEKVVVDNISLRLRKGEILGLVGESGSGKTQTAFSILGLLPETAVIRAKQIIVAGQDTLAMTPSMWNTLRGRRIGYIPQEPMSNLDPAFRIGYQLVQPMKIHLGLSRRAAEAEALRLLRSVGIADPERVYKAYPHEISGGMAQRVLIAGAVSCNPTILIADEPTTALDVTVQADVLNVIRSLQAERGMGVLLVTHNFGVVADLCDTVVVMKGGKIMESAPVDQFFANPQNEYSRMLLASTLEGVDARAERDAAADRSVSETTI